MCACVRVPRCMCAAVVCVSRGSAFGGPSEPSKRHLSDSGVEENSRTVAEWRSYGSRATPMIGWGQPFTVSCVADASMLSWLPVRLLYKSTCDAIYAMMTHSHWSSALGSKTC
jgi:hypothetical protein